MKLYNLTAFELLWERERDTKALLAWNDDTVVLAFRGTASLRNVLSDLQARFCEERSGTQCGRQRPGIIIQLRVLGELYVMALLTASRPSVRGFPRLTCAQRRPSGFGSAGDRV